MKSTNSGLSMKNAALITGFSLLLMAVFAPIANFGIVESLVVPGDPALTVDNINNAENDFRMAIFLFFIVALLDVIVAWSIFYLLLPVDRSLSLLGAWLRLVYAAILVIALGNYLNILDLLWGETSNLLTGNLLNAQVIMSLDAFHNAWGLGLIVFGFHLLVVGYLAYKADHIPSWLGILILIAGLGYAVDGLGGVLSSSYNLQLAMFTFIGEVLLIFWCLWVGFKGFPKQED